MVLPSVVQLDLYDSSELILLDTYPSGTYRQLSEIRGNSILSTVFVDQIDAGASLTVNYYDFTTGRSLGERFDLATHGSITSADVPTPTSFRLIVPRIHNAVVCEAILTGGSAKFSVYVTCVADFPQSPKLAEGDTVDIITDRGTPLTLYNETTGKWEFARSLNGSLQVSFYTPTTPTVTNFLISNKETEYTVSLPTDTRRFILQNRNNGTLRLAFNSSGTSSSYLTLFPGDRFEQKDLLLSSVNLYLWASKDNQTVEILSWA